MKRHAAVVLLALLALTIGLAAQTKAPATFADFGKWETLAPAGVRGGLSPDGRWVAYAISRTNRDNELVVANLADGTKKVAPMGTQPVFSSDYSRLGARRWAHARSGERAGSASSSCADDHGGRRPHQHRDPVVGFKRRTQEPRGGRPVGCGRHAAPSPALTAPAGSKRNRSVWAS